jgi:FRG domain
MYASKMSTWDEFEQTISRLRDSHKKAIGGILFRGQADSSWPLQTTLERRTGPQYKIQDYYFLILRIKDQIETFTNTQWVETPTFDEILELTTGKFEPFSRHLRHHGLPWYKHLVYLRHHGFPSPLLDWTSSLYVAAYFAFANVAKGVESVSIYVYCDEPNNYKLYGNDSPTITRLSPHVQTHKRHFLQKAEYTVCTFFDENSWQFVPHADIFENRHGRHGFQDFLYKFDIPAKEQVNVLRRLEEYNLNAYSLFGSEESLMETLAIRELLLRSPITQAHDQNSNTETPLKPSPSPDPTPSHQKPDPTS